MASYIATKGASLGRWSGNGYDAEAQIDEMAEVCGRLEAVEPIAPNVVRLRTLINDARRLMAEWGFLSPMLEAAGRAIENEDDEQLARAALVEV